MYNGDGAIDVNGVTVNLRGENQAVGKKFFEDGAAAWAEKCVRLHYDYVDDPTGLNSDIQVIKDMTGSASSCPNGDAACADQGGVQMHFTVDSKTGRYQGVASTPAHELGPIFGFFHFGSAQNSIMSYEGNARSILSSDVDNVRQLWRQKK